MSCVSSSTSHPRRRRHMKTKNYFSKFSKKISRRTPPPHFPIQMILTILYSETKAMGIVQCSDTNIHIQHPPSSIIPIALPACYTLKTNGYSIYIFVYTHRIKHKILYNCVYNKYHHAWHQVQYSSSKIGNWGEKPMTLYRVSRCVQQGGWVFMLEDSKYVCCYEYEKRWRLYGEWEWYVVNGMS